MDIQNLLASEEGKTLEFKQDLSSLKPILKTVVAFANTAGGRILIGVQDKTKHLLGVADPLKSEEKLISSISDNIIPQIIPSVEIVAFKNIQLLLVEVFPGPSAPYYLKNSGPDEGVFFRVGSSSRKADKEIIAEIKRTYTNKSFDEEPIPELSSEAIDFRLASECFSEYRVLKKNELESLQIITKYQKKKVPTVGGVLLFSHEKKQFFPDAYIKAGVFSGEDKSKILDSVHLEGNLIELIYSARKFIDKYVYHEYQIGKLKAKVKTSVPDVAIREALINAVVHADYSQTGSAITIAIFSNRIEIENPGLLRFGLTINEIKSGVSKLRNRVIGRVFEEVGLIEQWGSGIQRIISSCAESGLREPVFEEIGTHFRVTLFSEAVKNIDLDKKDKEIVSFLSKVKTVGASTTQIAETISLTPRATRTRLIKLSDKGVVTEVSTSPNDPQKKYILTKPQLCK